MHMPKVITIGETMASFSPGASGPLRYVSGYSIRTAGAESNVAVGLAKENPGDVEGYPDARQLEAALTGGKVIYR